MIEGVTIDDGTDILGRCASTTTLSKCLRASTFGLVSKAMTGLRVDFDVNANREVVTVTGPSVPVTSRSLSAPLCSVAEGVTEGVAVEDSADILGRCASTTTLSRVRVWTFGVVSGVVRGLRADFWWD